MRDRSDFLAPQLLRSYRDFCVSCAGDSEGGGDAEVVTWLVSILPTPRMKCSMVSATTPRVTVGSRSQRDISSAENLRQTLRSTPWGSGFADLSVGFEQGAVHLSGSVPSYHLKQMAQTLAARQSDGLRVVNSLVVRPVC